MNVELALFVALVLLLGNAFFVGAEFALVSVRRSAIEPKALSGSRPAIITLEALQNVSWLMAGAQLGITLCSLGLGALGEPAIAHMLEGPFTNFHLPEYLLHPVSFALALTIMVFLHVVFGEMIPKNIALAGPERTALRLVPILVFIVRIFNPIVVFLNGIANLCLRLVGIRPKDEVTATYSRDEVAELVEESRREGLLSGDEEQLLLGSIQLDTNTIKTVSIPIKNMVTVAKSVSPAEIEQLAASSGYSRFPVLSKGRPVGYVHLKDVLETVHDKRSKPIDSATIRPFVHVAPTESLRYTLKAMQRSESHLAALTDSKKKIIGLATLDDVLEELIGEMKIMPLV